ncbi:helix-turn-helix transcriptional regulator [Streptomyces sp. NPDC004539]|uniref:helix-turn-helix domain-containing protein n=1 Tax=Streptomyces sp. NPDC004539 TaxID=3154280 RepID=UPI0033A86D8B
MDENALGEFLRARRALVRPEDVGLPGGGLRRVPGLRREEVALLAGISADYYLRLEQGRDRNPSAQVLEALARVLRLDANTTAYLLGLTRPRARTGRPAAERVPDSLRQLLGTWDRHPAYVQNRLTDVLAANPMAVALSPKYRPGGNLLRSLFLSPADRENHHDWELITEEAVAVLRARTDADDPRLHALVEELSRGSDRFRTLWARHQVRRQMEHAIRMRHPQIGELELYKHKLSVDGYDSLSLVVFHAAPGSRSAELLDILGSLSAPAPQER